MKRLLCLFLVIAMLFLCSCAKEYDVDLSLVLDDINNQFKLDDMVEITDVAMLEDYYMIESGDVESFAAQYSADTSALTEIVFIKAKDKDSAKSIFTTLNNHYESRLTLVKSYSPELLDMISDCGVSQNDAYISLIIAEEATAIEEVYNSYFEK